MPTDFPWKGELFTFDNSLLNLGALASLTGPPLSGALGGGQTAAKHETRQHAATRMRRIAYFSTTLRERPDDEKETSTIVWMMSVVCEDMNSSHFK